MANKKISELVLSNNPPLSGVTAVVHGGTTYQSTLGTLRQLLVDSGSHAFTGSQTINGNLVISGSLTAQEYILSSSITNITTETISGSSRFGNSSDDVHSFTGSLRIDGRIDRLLVGTGSYLTGVDDDPEVLHVANSGSYNIAYFQSNNPYYSQLNVKNINNGYLSSTDIVATANNGNEGIHYVDMGINSSTYTGGFVGRANDAYLINVGKDLYLGTVGGAPSHFGKLKLFAMNSWEEPQITIDNNDGLNLISFNTGSVSTGYTYEFNGDVKVVDRINTTTLLSDGNLNLSTDGDTVYVLGSNFVVENGGITANYDLVAQADAYISGIANLGSTSETIIPLNDPTTGYTHDFTSGAILYVTGATSDITIDVINVPTSNNKGIGLTVMIEQGGTTYVIDSLKINTDDEGPVTIIWSGGSLPTGNPNSYDIVSFSILKINGAWIVFGQLTTF